MGIRVLSLGGLGMGPGKKRVRVERVMVECAGCMNFSVCKVAGMLRPSRFEDADFHSFSEFGRGSQGCEPLGHAWVYMVG